MDYGINKMDSFFFRSWIFLILGINLLLLFEVLLVLLLSILLRLLVFQQLAV